MTAQKPWAQPPAPTPAGPTSITDATPAFSAVLTNFGADVGSVDTPVKVANPAATGVWVCNGGEIDAWLWGGSSGAAIGYGIYLPARSQPIWLPYSGALSAIHIASAGATRIAGWEV